MANGDDELQVEPGVQWARDEGVTFETAPRSMRFVRVSLNELDDLKSSGNSLELGLGGMCVGALMTCATTLSTVTLTDLLTKGIFIVLTIVFGLFSVYFGIGAYRAEMKWRNRIDRLKRGQD